MPCPKDQYKEDHRTFLKYWSKGLHQLEIARIMNLSDRQARDHALDAYEENAQRNAPEYSCIRWVKLNDELKKDFPGKNNDIVKYYKDCNRLILELIGEETAYNQD